MAQPERNRSSLDGFNGALQVAGNNGSPNRDLMLPRNSLSGRSTSPGPKIGPRATPPTGIKEQLRDAAQRIADRIDDQIRDGMLAGPPT